MVQLLYSEMLKLIGPGVWVYLGVKDGYDLITVIKTVNLGNLQTNVEFWWRMLEVKRLKTVGLFSISMITFPSLKIFGLRGFIFLLLIHFTSTLTKPKHSRVSSTATKENHLKSPMAIPTVTNK